MADYRYRALTAEGSITEGEVTAGGRTEAFRVLEERGLNPVGLTQKDEVKPRHKSSTWTLSTGRRKVTFTALENFTRQLANLLAAGVPLSRSLRILCREVSSHAAKAKWQEIHDKVIDGMSLADSMAQAPETFPRVYVAMVRAGETGGFLDLVLRQIADFQRNEKELKSTVVSALIYPAVLAVLATGVLAFLLTYFVPRFQSIFSDFGAALPILTQMIIKASEVVTKYILLVVVILVLVVFGVRGWFRTEQGRRAWDTWLLKFPVVGKIAAMFAMVRFCRMLGTLVKAGVPLINALRVARESIGNQQLVDAVTKSIENVQKGERLAPSLANCPMLFPASVIEMISVAEETGQLDEELVRMAEVSEEDLNRQLKMAVSLAEPALLFLMAGIIGIIVVGMLLPIFSLQEFVK